MMIVNEIYLSRIIVNPHNSEVRGDLADCQRMHCRIMKAFPQVDGGNPRQRFGVLYRIDTDRRGATTLLVQSHIEPDWKILPTHHASEPYCIISESGQPNPAYKRIEETYAALRPGQRFHFRLRANPTRRVSEKCSLETGKGFGKRVELYREEDQIAWLERKGKGDPDRKIRAFGFQLVTAKTKPDVPSVQVSPEGKRFSRKKNMAFNSVLFEGILEITNIDEFNEALRGGIGPGKAYGFGLLSISRLSE